MNKPISEWPVSIIVAFAMTIGCGYVLNIYWGQMIGDLGEISLPMVYVGVSSIASVGIWIETVRSYKRYQERGYWTQDVPPAEPGKPAWPKKQADSPEPDNKQVKVFKIDE
jgi:hypothetical protein